ncbi:lycopene cyclase [Sinomonas susongensis]|uniref:lycopene cyclase n=1 Tax=Sinomonas susongensis TaxID=1324851 RepID=UPI001109C6D8|nr:lycopene cyclase [Sinomonas susongensis]
MTYALIDVVFLAVVFLMVVFLATAAGLFRVQKPPVAGFRSAHRPARTPFWRPVLAGAAVLLVLTAVFDSAMIAVGLFGYRPEALSGLFVGLAPVEDFAYPLAAAVMLPALWRAIGPTGSPGPAPSDPKGDT